MIPVLLQIRMQYDLNMNTRAFDSLQTLLSVVRAYPLIDNGDHNGLVIRRELADYSHVLSIKLVLCVVYQEDYVIHNVGHLSKWVFLVVMDNSGVYLQLLYLAIPMSVCHTLTFCRFPNFAFAL